MFIPFTTRPKQDFVRSNKITSSKSTGPELYDFISGNYDSVDSIIDDVLEVMFEVCSDNYGDPLPEVFNKAKGKLNEIEQSYKQTAEDLSGESW